MSSYNYRRAPNVSQYLAGLNMPAQDMTNQNELSFDTGFDDLATLDFFDIDGAVQFHQSPFPETHDAETGQFQFNEFQTFNNQTNPTSPSSAVPSTPAAALHGQYPTQPAHFTPTTGDKRKATIAGLTSAADLEESSRMAAEEDKRRRNTAASARFRVKKKQREQALEKQAKEMSDKVTQLESKVQQLEMENKWLKGLITEKSDGNDFATMQSEKESEERSTENRTDGVGTDGQADAVEA